MFSDPYIETMEKAVGVTNGELFYVSGSFNHAMAKTVCEAFGGDLAAKSDVARAAANAAFGYCKT